MLISRGALRVASRRGVASRTLATAARVAKNESTTSRQLAPLFAAGGLAIAATALYREASGYESFCVFGRSECEWILLTNSPLYYLSIT